jgi:hypothetical protein
MVWTVLKAWAVALALSPLFLIKRIPNQLQRKVSWRDVDEWHRRFGLNVEALCLLDRQRTDHRQPT